MDITPRCQQVIDCARSAVSRFGHPCLCGAHLLFGLLRVNSGACCALETAGLSADAVESHLQGLSLPARPTMKKRGALVSKSVMQTMERAEAEAEKTGCAYVGTEHVLLALLAETDGDAHAILDAHGVDRVTMRQSLGAARVQIIWPEFKDPDA